MPLSLSQIPSEWLAPDELEHLRRPTRRKQDILTPEEIQCLREIHALFVVRYVKMTPETGEKLINCIKTDCFDSVLKATTVFEYPDISHIYVECWDKGLLVEKLTQWFHENSKSDDFEDDIIELDDGWFRWTISIGGPFAIYSKTLQKKCLIFIIKKIFMSFYSIQNTTLILNVLGQANAKQDSFGKIVGDRIKIYVKKNPENGAATEYMRKFIAASFSVPLKQVTVLYGETSSQKSFKIILPNVIPEKLKSYINPEEINF